MSGFLLDTSILSGFAPGRPALTQAQAEWFRRINSGLFVPSIAIAKIADGVAKLRRSGAKAKSDALAAWMEALILGYGERALAFDASAAERAGALSDGACANGRRPGFSDIAIAPIAGTRGLTIATRNLKHFGAIGAACLDPFSHDNAKPHAP